jgi:hypothetical protein
MPNYASRTAPCSGASLTLLGSIRGMTPILSLPIN